MVSVPVDGLPGVRHPAGFAAGNVGDYVNPPHCWASTPPANNTDPDGNPIAFSSGAHGQDGRSTTTPVAAPVPATTTTSSPMSSHRAWARAPPTWATPTTAASAAPPQPARTRPAACPGALGESALTVAEVEQMIRDAANDVDDSCGQPNESPDWNNKFGEGYLIARSGADGGGWLRRWRALSPIWTPARLSPPRSLRRAACIL